MGAIRPTAGSPYVVSTKIAIAVQNTVEPMDNGGFRLLASSLFLAKGWRFDLPSLDFATSDRDALLTPASSGSSAALRRLQQWLEAAWAGRLPARTKVQDGSIRAVGDGFELLVQSYCDGSGTDIDIDKADQARPAVASDQALKSVLSGEPSFRPEERTSVLFPGQEGGAVLEVTKVLIGADGFLRFELPDFSWVREWTGKPEDVYAAATEFTLAYLQSNYAGVDTWFATKLAWGEGVGFHVYRLTFDESRARGSDAAGAMRPGTTSGADMLVGSARAGNRVFVNAVFVPNARSSADWSYPGALELLSSFRDDKGESVGYPPQVGDPIVGFSHASVGNKPYFDSSANDKGGSANSLSVGAFADACSALASTIASKRQQATYVARKGSMFRKLLKIFLFILIIVIAFNFPAILSWASSFVGTALGITIPAISTLSIPWWVGAVVGIGLSYLIAPGATKELISDVGKAVGSVAVAAADAAASAGTAVFTNLLPIAAAVGAFFLLARKKDKKQEEKPVEAQEVLA